MRHSASLQSIQPMTLIAEHLCPFPFQTESVGLEDTGGNGHTSRKSQALQGQRTSERRRPFAVCELHIIEPEGQISHFEDDASTSLRSQPCETHI